MHVRKIISAVAIIIAVLVITAIGAVLIVLSRKPVARTVVLEQAKVDLSKVQPESNPRIPADTTAENRRCVQNLLQLGLGMLMYANAQKDGSFPPDLATLLLTQDLSANLFLDPRRGNTLPPEVASVPLKEQAPWINSHSDFLYFGAGKNNRAKSTDALAMEKPGGLPMRPGSSVEEVNILFADGHVEAWTAPMATELLKRLRTEAAKPSTGPTAPQ